VGERSLPGLTNKCHELRRPEISFRDRGLLQDVRPPCRIPFVSLHFSIMTKEASNQEDWGMDFSSITKEAANEADWTTGFASVIDGFGLRVQGGGSWQMYYFLGLEVRQRSGEIFLGQGILMRFDMMDCNSMAKSMETNIKNLSDSASDSDLVDPKMYREWIGFLMYLVNTMIDILFIESTQC
jgi:hypothetical protein